MKKIFTLILTIATTLQATAQVGSWAKTSPPNYDLTAREDAGMVALNNKLYILGGANNSGPKDFTEYDPSTGKIKKLADIGVGAANPLRGGCLFAVQGKIYSFSPYGTGVAVYNPVNNNWVLNTSSLPAGLIPDAGFVINDTIFLTSSSGNLFYAYNVVKNSFIQKADYPGTANSRYAMGFAINNKGYFGGGRTYTYDGCSNESGCFSNTFYEYNPTTNTWATKANLPLAYNGGVGIGYNGKGYAGTGEYYYSPIIPTMKSHFWYEYDPALNTWSPKQSLMNVDITDYSSGYNVLQASIAIIADNVYLFGGTAGYRGSVFTDNLYKYNITANNWQAVNMELGGNRTEASGFYTNGKLYVGGGHDDESLYDFWEYTIATATWTPKAKFSSPHERRSTVELNGKGYFIGGYGKNVLSVPNSTVNRKYIDSLLEYNPATNKWAAKASFPGGKRGSMVALSYNNKIYAGMGVDSNGSWTNRDFYEYNPTNNSWLAKSHAPIGSNGISGGSNISYFVLGDTAYVTRLNSNENSHYMFKYSFLSDKWVYAPLPAIINNSNSTTHTINRAFVYNNKGYLVYGEYNNGNKLSEYDPTSGWKQILNMPFKITDQTIIPAPNGVYFGFGTNEFSLKSNEWNLLRFNAGVSNHLGIYQSVVNSSYGPACGTGTLSKNVSHTTHDNIGNLFVAVLADNFSTIGGTCLEVSSIDTLQGYRTANGKFGHTYNENALFLNKSVLFPSNESIPNGGSLKLYYTTGELTKFVQNFNSQYGTNKTIDSVKIVRYFEYNKNDANPLNNTADPYILFKSTISNYGADKCFEIPSISGANVSGEIYAVLTTTALLTSTKDIVKDNSIHIYPNPTNGMLTIELDSEIETLLTLYNTTGQKIISKITQEKISTIDLSNFANDIYYLQIKTEGKSFVKKIIINK